MRLVDTSAWVEWLIGSTTGEAVARAIPAQPDWLVPTIVQLELAKWLRREVGEEKADQVLAFTQLCRIVPLDTRVALLAADLCIEHKLATADAVIYATAREHGADLLTCDAHFEGLPGISYIAKLAA